MRVRGFSFFLVASGSLHFSLLLLKKPVEPLPQAKETLHEVFSEKKATGQSSISAKQLAISPKGFSFGAYRFDPNSEIQGDPNARPIEFGTTEAVGPEGIRQSGYLKRLHSFIDESITYPKEFIENGVEGVITGKLHFNENGEFDYLQSTFKSNSNYLRLWARRHFKELFRKEMPFLKAGGREVRVAYQIEFRLGSPVLFGNFAGEANGKKNFVETLTPQPKNTKNGVASNRLFFYRTGSKTYGIGLAGMDDGGVPVFMPTVDLLGLLDRVERVLGLSEDQKHERNMLEIWRGHPEWGR